jgi:hypothetical protein
MRSFTSDRFSTDDHHRRVSDAQSDHEPLSAVGLLVRISLFLLIVLGLPMTAQNLSGAPR